MGVWNGVELDDLALASKRLTLRPWRAGDAAAVAAIMAEPAMHGFLPLPEPYTRADAEQFVTDFGVRGRHAGTNIACAVTETDSGRVVGAVELRLPGEREVTGEIGYWIGRPAQGNGYAAEASGAIAEWAFTHGVHRVEIRCAVGNVASAKSALNAGFRFEGVLRGKEMTPRGPEDGAIFARLTGDDGQPTSRAFPPLPADGLSDGTLTLRMQVADDAEAVHEEISNDEAMRWAFDAAAPDRAGSVERAAQAPLRWLVGPVANLAMVDVATGVTAGTIQLRRSGPPGVGGIGYGVRPAYRGRGYTARALRLLVRWAFKHGGFGRLELGAKEGNVASQRAALAGGFEPDGVREGRLANPDGSFSDEVRFALVNPKLQTVSRISP